MKKRSLILLLFAIALVVFAACSTQDTPASNGSEAGHKLTLSGITAEPLTFSIEELKGMTGTTQQVEGIRSSGETSTVKATGVLLENILAEQNQSLANFSSIRFIAADGYGVEVPAELLQRKDIILAYEIDDAALKGIRSIVPGERTMFWVHNLAEITFEEAAPIAAITEVYFFETLVNMLSSETYQYRGAEDQAVKISALVEQLDITEGYSGVFLRALDGLEKMESSEALNYAYLKYTGADSPLFGAPDMHPGMQVKEVLWFTIVDKAVLTVNLAQEHYDPTTLDGREGILLSDLLSDFNMDVGASYNLVAADGYEIEIEAKEMDNGIVYLDDEGICRVYFPELPRNHNIKGLLYIKIAD